MRTLVETGVLVGDAGGLSPGAGRRRAFRCPPRCRRCWRRASIGCRRRRSASSRPPRSLARRCPCALLQAIAELSEEALHRGLAHLQAAEFLYETRLFPEHAYTFKHALTHEVAYGSLLQERRRVLHARIVEALEGLAARPRRPSRSNGWRIMPCGARCGKRPWRTVGRRGRRPWRGRPTARPWGTSSRRSVPSPHLPETRDTREQAIDLRLALRSALLPSGDSGRILACLREAEALAAALDDPRRLGQVSGFLSLHVHRMGAHDQAIAAGQRALALATAGGDVVLQALANQYLGIAYWGPGRLSSGDRLFRADRGVPRRGAAPRALRPSVPARRPLPCLPRLVPCRAGHVRRGQTLGDEGLRIAEAVAHPGSLRWAYYGIGLLSLRQGDLPRALPRLERAVGLCQDADLPAYSPWMAAALGAAYTLGGRIADAVPLLTQALEQATAMERVDYSGALSVSPWERRRCWLAAWRRRMPSPSVRWR